MTDPASGGGTNYWIDVQVNAGGTDITVPMGSALAVAAAAPGPQLMSLSSPAYASSASGLSGGTGTWSSTGNATSGPDGSVATWTVV